MGCHLWQNAYKMAPIKSAVFMKSLSILVNKPRFNPHLDLVNPPVNPLLDLVNLHLDIANTHLDLANAHIYLVNTHVNLANMQLQPPCWFSKYAPWCVHVLEAPGTSALPHMCIHVDRCPRHVLCFLGLCLSRAVQLDLILGSLRAAADDSNDDITPATMGTTTLAIVVGSKGEPGLGFAMK